MNISNSDLPPSEPTSPVPMIEDRKSSRKMFVVTTALLIFAMGIGIGFAGGVFQTTGDLSYAQALHILHLDRSEDHTSEAVDMSLFWKVWDAVKERHVNQPVDEQKIFYGALAGMVGGLGDPYSVFFDPEASKEFMGEIHGSFEGIGAEIGLKNTVITVIAPLADSPAEKAGVRAGDHILAINDLDTAYMSVNTAVDNIRGEKGTSVKLLMQRDGVVDPFELTIERDTIHIESVIWEVVTQGEQKIAVITVTHFNSDTSAKFQEAMNAVLLEQPASVILDLRNNPGGYLDAAVDISSTFLKEGTTVLYEQSSDQTEKSYTASGPSPFQGLSVVVLINSGSASASEIVSGALQDNGIATLIGVTSYGKGTVQDVETFDDGSTLKLTVARWLTPEHHQIDKVGIYPDYEVDLTNDDYSNNRDPQMDAAKQFLSDRTAFDQSHTVFTPPQE